MENRMLVPRKPTTSANCAVLPDTDSLPLVRVVDDEPSIHTLFRRLGELGGCAVEAYSNGGDLLQHLDERRAGCLVLDLVLPDSTGLDLLQELSRRQCRLPVVFMSGMARISEAVQALKLGSFDFVEKPFDLPAMLRVVQQAIDIDQQHRRQDHDQDSIRRRFEALTPREAEVMEQIVLGAANKEVAARLGLSPKTIEVHRANVMRKTHARSLAELVRMHVTVHA
jgi:FixJ family two-component response regulator